MSEHLSILAKENPGISHAGKMSSARKDVLKSVKKETKALADVKNIVYLRKTKSSELPLKKPAPFDKNYQLNPEKSKKHESVVDNCATSIIKEIPAPVIKITSDDTDIEEDIVSLPIPGSVAVSDDDSDDFDIDDCPSCIKNDDDDDWYNDFGWKKFTDEDIEKICCDPVPRDGPPSPQLTIDDWYKAHYQPMSPTSLGELSDEYSLSPFKQPDEFWLSRCDEVVPVTYED